MNGTTGIDEAIAPAASNVRALLSRAGAAAPAELVAQALASDPQAVCRRLLLTLLFTDMVGSTRLVEHMGDQAWQRLLQRHRAIVRSQLASLGGVEVDCCGDGFFAIFAGPALALQCAARVIHALLGAGIEIRAGVHAGECDVDGAATSVSGLAVHVAARIASLARPREILVSDTVRDLVAGSGLGFADRGRRTLKGLTGSRRLFALNGSGAVGHETTPAEPRLHLIDGHAPDRRAHAGNAG